MLTSAEKLETDRQANTDRRLDRHTPISDKQERRAGLDRRERQSDETKVQRQAEKKTLAQE